MGLSILNIDPKDEASIGRFVTDAWAVRHSYKYALERQWFLQIAWFKGNQNVIWDDASRILREPQAPPWRVRLVINLVQGAIRTIVSKYVRPRTEWDIIPNTDDPLDIETAALDKSVLKNYWHTEKCAEKMLDAIEWMCQTGNAFIKVSWNPNKGELLGASQSDLLDEYYETNDPQRAARLAAATRKYGNVADLKTGDLEIEVVPPFEIMLDPLAIKGVEDSNWILRSRIYDVNIVKEDWDVDDLVIEPGYYSSSAIFNYRERIKRLTSFRSTTNSGGEMSENACLVHELYIKPRGKGKLADGLYAVVCQGKVLNGGVPFPYNHGKLPFVQLKEIEVKGSPWGTSTLEALIALQADYNRTKSQLVESRNMIGKPKWLVPNNSGMPDSYIDSEPGQVIKYNVGFKPEMVSPPTMPSYIENLLVSYRQDLEDISGQHEVTRAEAPGQVRSGRGVLALIEQDETRLGPGLERIDEKTAEIGKLAICTLTQYVKETRVMKVVGDDDEFIVSEWSGKELLGRNYNRPSYSYFDVRISSVSGLPNSRAAQIGLIDTLAERGFLNPETDRKIVFKMLGVGRVQSELDKSRIHRTRALVENKQIQDGQLPTVEPYQDHDAHLEIHNAFRNSAAYDKLDDQVKQMFTVHEQQHKEMRAMVMVEPAILEKMAIQKLIMLHGIAPNPVQGQGQQQGGPANNPMPSGTPDGA